MIVTLAVILQGLASPHSPERSAAVCSPVDTAYFTATSLRDRESWYGKHLRAMGEHRLCAAPGVEAYRFLWLRTFHHPVLIRLDRTPRGYQLRAVKLSGAGGYEPGTISRTITRRLSASEGARFDSLVQASQYWALPTDPPRSDAIGEDGAQWILEGVRNAAYHVVDRWTPGSDSDDVAYRELCAYLIHVSRIPIVPGEIY